MKRVLFLRLTVLALALSLGYSCTALRATFYGQSDIDDARLFEQDTIYKSDNPFMFAKRDSSVVGVLDTMKFYSQYEDEKMTVEEIFTASYRRSALIIIQNDTIKYEKYFKGYQPDDVFIIFSVSKSITSLLCGIAVDEGYIESVDDPVTKYLPELLDKDPMFQELTIDHLLNMRAGLKFKENYTPNPFSLMASLYYGPNHLRLAKSLKFEHKPGEKHYYNSMATLILGLALERAIGVPYAEYFDEKVCKPLGIEYNVGITLDSKRNRNARTFGGIAMHIKDLAKIGRLYLNKGNWNGKQIVSAEWIEPQLDITNYGREGYYRSWYSTNVYFKNDEGKTSFKDLQDLKDCFKLCNIPKENTYMYKERYGDYKGYYRGYYRVASSYSALGLYGQTLYINTEKNIVAVRLGEGKPFEVEETLEKIFSIATEQSDCL